MAKFVYSARPVTGGDIQTGELDVKTKDEVMAYLHRQKMIPVSVREKEAGITIHPGEAGPGRGAALGANAGLS